MINTNLLTECDKGIFKIKVYGTKDEPWFIAVDVLRMLGMHTKNVSRALENLDDDEKLVVKLTTNSSERYKTGNPDIWMISEPGFYKIALSS